MSVTLTESPSPTTAGDGWKVFVSNVMVDTTVTYQWGSTAKGNQNQTAWIMFEPNIPAGSTLEAVELDLYNEVLNTIVNTIQSWSLGWLDTDGTWNVQASGLGWDEYALGVNPTNAPGMHPSRDNSSNTNWVNNFPSFFETWTSGGSPAPPASATRVTFSDGGDIAADWEDAAFLTDAQDAFDNNEVNRTATGVPMALVFTPSGAQNTQLLLSSPRSATAAQRPVLTIVYAPPPIAAELSSSASTDADLIGDFTLATELSSPATLDADIMLTAAGAAELSAQATLDADIDAIYGVATELSASTTVDADVNITVGLATELAASTAVDADIDAIYGVATELAAATTLDAAGEVAISAASELAAATTIDAQLLGFKDLAIELATGTAVDAAADVTLIALAELASSSALDADALATRLAATELSAQATLDALLIGLFFIDAEILGFATLDALPRGSATANSPLEILYMVDNVGVNYKAGNVEVTATNDTVEVMNPPRNAEAGEG